MALKTEFTGPMSEVRGQLRVVAVFSFAVNLLLLSSSIYMLQVFDRVLSTGSLDTLVWLTVAALVAIATYGLLEHARRRLLARAGTWLEAELSAPVIRRVVDARLAGGKADASISDVNDLKTFISGEAVLAFLDAPWMPLFIGIIWLMHPALGVLALIGALILFAIALYNDFATRKAVNRASAEVRGLQATALQVMDEGETVRPLGMAGPILKAWRERQHLAHGRMHEATDVTEAMASLTRAVRLALQVLILGLGAYLVLGGELTSGGMIAASIILSRALSPVERALSAWRSWSAARIARRNLQKLFESSPERAEKLELPKPVGRLEVEALAYGLPGAAEKILKRVDFALEPGKTCAVIGPSGSGKSTLCRLLVGAWTPSSGHVRLDAADVSSWDPDVLGRHVGYLPQRVELFSGTIAQNIARMGPVDSEAVIRAARLADVHEMILRLPGGYDTEVGPHGGQLSGGQRQRIGLARALYGDPVLIVLDEPNSNLDMNGEHALLATLERLKKLGRTIVIVAHRPSALRTADVALLLNDGMVAAFGDRDEVLKAIMGPQQRIVPMPGRARPVMARPEPKAPPAPGSDGSEAAEPRNEVAG